MSYQYESGHWYYATDDRGRRIIALLPADAAQVPEAGGVIEDLGKSLGSTVIGPALGGVLADPSTRAELQSLIRDSLTDPATREAARGYMIEAAAWVAAGVLGGAALYRLIWR